MWKSHSSPCCIWIPRVDNRVDNLWIILDNYGVIHRRFFRTRIIHKRRFLSTGFLGFSTGFSTVSGKK